MTIPYAVTKLIMMTNTPKIFFHTIGCRTNQYETAVMRNSFQQFGGYSIVSDSKNADVAVINTCTVTEKSDIDTRKIINKLVRQNPHIKICLTGCQAQLQAPLLKQLSNVCWVIGNKDKFSLPEMINQHQACSETLVSVDMLESAEPFIMNTPGTDNEHTRANIKIQDGCDNFCTYCEVPFARGRARSRIIDDIIKEAEILVSAGHQELVLTGINIGAYRFKKNTLIDVIQKLEQLKRLKRIRISSIEPTEILTPLIKYMKTSKKLCRYLHIPLQHGHDAILKKMGRRYTIKNACQLISDAKDNIKDICVGTDVIVGFPGEEMEHFQATYDFLKTAGVDYFHVFSFSKRPNAKAGKYKNQIPVEVIQERSRKLRGLSVRKRNHFFKSHLGKTLPVLFEQQKNGEWRGTTDNFIQVRVISNKNLKNSIRHVKLLDINGQVINGNLFS